MDAKAAIRPLAQFVRDCPGRMSALVVHDVEEGAAALQLLEQELAGSVPVEIIVGQAYPDRLADRAIELAAADRLLVLVLTDDEGFRDEAEAGHYWRRLNLQREQLATGMLRTLLLLGPRNEERFLISAGDLRDWTVVYRLSGSDDEPAEAKTGEDRDSNTTVRLTDASERIETLLRQLARARGAFPATTTARTYAYPLFRALLEEERFEEAERIWREDLANGERLRLQDRTNAEALLRTRPSSQVGWIHLADLLFGAGDDDPGEAGRFALLDDVAMFVGRTEAFRGAVQIPINFIFITGDIARTGQRAEFRRAEEFVTALRQLTGVAPERVFLVPGNHDVNHDDGPLTENITPFAMNFTALWRDPFTRRSIFGARLEAYREFARRVNPVLSLPSDEPGGFIARAVARGRSLRVLGLSSIGLSSKADRSGSLVVGDEQVRSLLDADRASHLAPADLSVTLLHHAPEWLRNEDREALGRVLSEESDLLLHSGRHVGTFERDEVTPGRPARISTPVGLSDGAFGYSLGLVDVVSEPQLRAWFRRYEPALRQFVPTGRSSTRTGPIRVALRSARSSPIDSVERGERREIRAYLERVVEANRSLDIRGMGAKVAERMELEDLYTQLCVLGGKSVREVDHEIDDPVPMAHEAAGPLPLREVLGENRNLVILGDPGSGKTTFLRYVALQLARARLGQGRQAALDRIGLVETAPLPITLRLGPFAQYLLESPARGLAEDSREHLYRYLASERSEASGLASADGFRERIEGGGCFLLLDGLDEAPGDALRERVTAIVQDLVSFDGAQANHHLVTSRTRGYDREETLRSKFTHCALVDFGEEERDEFLRRWSRALHRVGIDSDSTSTAEAYRTELAGAIRAHLAVRPLTGNPLMLTTLCVVHWSRKKLPEQRAELYNQLIDVLLETRERQSPVPNPLRRECFRALALRMHTDRDGIRKTYPRVEAAAAIREVLDTSEGAASAFLEQEEMYSGIIVQRIPGQVEFWHLTFQEYLAADALAVSPDYWGVIQPRLADDRWIETLLLLAGCRRRQALEQAADLIEHVLGSARSLAERARCVGLVGRMLRDIEPYGGDVGKRTTFHAALTQVRDVLEQPVPAVEENIRIEVGEALGRAGDPRLNLDRRAVGPRTEVPGGVLWQDRSSTREGKPKRSQKRAETVRDSGTTSVRPVQISTFWISTYPITVAHFEKFMDDKQDGYEAKTCWSSAGLTWRGKTPDRAGPSDWEEQIAHPNWPVVGVSWYEAEAYCVWADGLLPTEAQWEFAARGKEGRTYPWGDKEPTRAHANFAGRVGGPSPVGVYPRGRTPLGVQDLAGNVWEWCADWYGEGFPGAGDDPTGPHSGRSRVLRGGSFLNDADILRAAFRSFILPPEYVILNVGFRCVWVSAGGQKGP